MPCAERWANKKPGEAGFCDLLVELGERLDALGTQHLAHVHAILLDAHALEVWLELAPGGSHRMAAAVAEHGAFAAHFASSHKVASKKVTINGRSNPDATIQLPSMQG